MRDLTLARAGRTVLAGASFAVHPGDLIEVTGPNGAGKSTLLRAMAGLLAPAAGTLGWRRQDGSDDPAPLADGLHYLGHRDGLKDGLTARRNLAFARALLGGGGVEPEAALAQLGLAHLADLPVAVLSAGQRRRVALARLLVAPRPLWLLDEPATALDEAARGTLTTLIAGHLAGGGSVVAATHAPLGLPAQTLRLEP